MNLASALTFCTFYYFALGERHKRKFDEELDTKRYKEEVEAAGDNAMEFLGQHHHEPSVYTNLGRRFIPVQPYKDSEESKEKQRDDTEEILQYIMPPKKVKKDKIREVIPIRAPPEVVLAVMRNATQSDSSQPSDSTKEVIKEYMLRSGDYWDGVWVEEGNPESMLRTNDLDKEDSDEEDVMFKNAVPISAKLLPGSKLYDLVSGIVKKTPRLVYIINDE